VSAEDLYWSAIDVVNGLISGTMLGGYYAIIAAGLALTFGVMRLVNLAHGDFLVIAAYLAALLLQLLPVSPFLTLLVVAPVMYAIGYGLQRGLLNRVSVQSMEQRGLPPSFGIMSPLLVTFGCSIVIAQALLGLFSADMHSIPTALAFSALRVTEDIQVSTLRLISFAITVAILLALQTFLTRTHIGRAIRAASDDVETAELMGMVPNRIYAVASGLSLAIAGVGGVMMGMSRPFGPFDGPQFLLISFGVVIVSGLGSILGSLAGGILLGIVQVMAGTYFGPSAQLVAGYVLILAVLAFRPQGLFAR
jgi:branched-chain amino acid transport system permease protein